MFQGEYSAILSTFIKLPFVVKIFVLSIIKWSFYTGFTVVPYDHTGIFETEMTTTDKEQIRDELNKLIYRVMRKYPRNYISS